MKKILAAVLLFSLPIILGAWLLVRRGSVVNAPEDTPSTFRTEPFGIGTLYRHSGEQAPLRALRWLAPQPDGIQALQVVTQSDRQRLVLFRDGNQVADLLVPRPSGIREGFFNFAELSEAIILPDLAILFYRSANPSGGELPLVVAQELATGELRWVHRAAGDHIVPTSDAKDEAVYLYGSTSPVLRLPLALQKAERPGSTPFRGALKPMEMPEEIQTISGFLPTSAGSFLLAHAAGISAFSPNKGWRHWPMPSQGSLTFTDSRSTLAASKGYWWQPFPGKLIQVQADGTPLGTEVSLPAPAEPWSRDRALLRLMGADPSGNLWFSLAAPSMSSPVATPEPQPSGEPPPAAVSGTDAASEEVLKSGTTPPLADSDEWTSYLARGLDRAYLWHPEQRILRQVDLSKFWTTLAFPPGLNRPATFPNLRPATGAALVESGSTAWRIPLEALIKTSN